MTRASIDSVGPPGSAGKAGPVSEAVEPDGHRVGSACRSSVSRICCAGAGKASRDAWPGRRPRSDRAGHEHRDPQACLESARQPTGRRHRVRMWPAAGRDRRGHGAEHRDAADQAAAVAFPAVPVAPPRHHGGAAVCGRRSVLPGAGRHAVGAQPGLAPGPAQAAAGQRGRRRGHGQPHPGGLLRYRELRGVWPDIGAGR